MASFAQQRDFVTTWWPKAQAVGAATGFNPELVLATWALDTGWGDAELMMSNHALLGIACYTDQYPCGLGTRNFHRFDSWEDFLAAYTHVLNLGHYDVVRRQPDLAGQNWALATQTGFAGHEGTYQGKLVSVEATNRQLIGVTPEPAQEAALPVAAAAPPSGQSSGKGGQLILGATVVIAMLVLLR